jgi:hypothetical protein
MADMMAAAAGAYEALDAVIAPDRLAEIVEIAVAHSDSDIQQFTWFAEHFLQTQERAPGMVLEVGTRAGGSAYLWLRLLEEIVGAMPPLVATVDPYGGRPYNDGRQVGRHYYGDEHYLAQRALLAPFSNHTHWMLPSRDFFALAVRGIPYWRNGVSYMYGNVGWAYLDGEHDADSILRDVETLIETPGMMASGGAIMIDNVDYSPTTVDALTPYAPSYDPRGFSAVIQVMR